MKMKLTSLIHILTWAYTFLVLKITDTGSEMLFRSIGPQEERNASVVFKNLHKCSCLANEWWFMNSCQEGATTIQVVLDMYSSSTQVIDTNVIESVEVGGIECPSHYLNITLPGESFALRTSGELFNFNYGLSLEFSKYCVEHFYNNNRQEVQLEVSLCLPIPSVPKCCPDELYDSYTKTCNDKNDTNSVISFLLGSHYFQTETESFPNVLSCQDGDNRTYVSMSETTGTGSLKLTDEGLVLSHQVTVVGDKVLIPSPKYCLQFDETNENVLAASYCYEDPISAHLRDCSGITCIRKCCPANEIYDMDKFKCIHVNEKKRWVPRMYNIENLNDWTNESLDIKLSIGFPINCKVFPLQPSNDPPDIFKLLTNGSLYVENFFKAFPAFQYCIDNFRHGSIVSEEALVCFPEHVEESTDCKNVELLYPILLMTSCVFMAITLVVYAMIPDLHVKVQGKCLIASISSLIAFYIFMVVVQLSSSNLSVTSCVTLGLFFWLNVMSFDIWRTLSSMKSGRRSKSSARRRYVLFSLYAWGIPLVISLITVIMQLVPSSDSGLILPRIGETDCFFPKTDTKPLWVYFYGFISVTLLINTVIFVHLAIILLRAKQISEAALGKKNQIHKEWAKLYLKLFLIMGITWIFEVVSWIEGSCGFWIATDITNSLRGLLIFIIFVCKKDVIKKLLSESSPAFHRMRTTMRQSSIFSRSSNKRTSNFYIDPSSSAGTQEISHSPPQENQNHADVPL